MTITINGREYSMATTLRVAYLVQGQHNHRAYSEVFQRIGDMTVEDQLGMLYCSFQCANPSVFSKQEFTDYCLDNMNLKEMLDKLKELVEGIMGTSLETEESRVSTESNKSDATPQ